MNEKKIIAGLNDLLARNYDAEQGFESAAEKTDNTILARLYHEKASNRCLYGHQIKDVLREMEGDIDKGSSVAGDVHNAWLNFKALITGHSDEAILEEVERGESAALDTYDQFLAENQLPHSIRRIITHQRDAIAKSLKKAQKLEKVYS